MFNTIKMWIIGGIAVLVSGLLVMLKLKTMEVSDLESKTKTQETYIRTIKEVNESDELADDVEDDVDENTNHIKSDQEVDDAIEVFKSSNELRI